MGASGTVANPTGAMDIEGGWGWRECTRSRTPAVAKLAGTWWCKMGASGTGANPTGAMDMGGTGGSARSAVPRDCVGLGASATLMPMPKPQSGPHPGPLDRYAR